MKMESGQYYCVTTRRFTLQCNHQEWLVRTQELYGQVLLFYYNLYLDREETDPGSLSVLSNQQALRALEVLTVVGRDRQPVPCPLPWERIPLYFRRAAINGAIACARRQEGQSRAGMSVKRLEAYCGGVTCYKGMYRDLSQEHISLRCYTGEEWRWQSCRLKGNFIPEGAVPLSPTLCPQGKGNVLLLPVKQPVRDGRKAKQRMEESACICSVQFTNGEAFAMAVVLESSGSQKAVRFFRGGSEYEHRCRVLTERIRASEQAMGIRVGNRPEKQDVPEVLSGPGKTGGEHYNNRYWMKLKHLGEYHAHRVSREIIRFSQENRAGIIVLPRYEERFHRCVMYKVGNWSSLHLSGRIREMIGYKAWQAGIVVLEVNARGTSVVCAVCGEKVRKAGSGFECPNGHRGSRYINTARNLGRKCLEGFGRL